MSRVLLSAAALAGVYLLVLTSVAAGDVLVGGALGLAVAFALRPHSEPASRPLVERVPAVAGLAARTAVEMVKGSWRVALFCAGRRSSPGLVEIPRGSRSAGEVAVWGLATGEAPDEVVVDVDEERGVLIVHLVDASDSDAVRARHALTHERWRGRGRTGA
jgi:multisubunit Na+/H+ antiporter MnhE subunit